ncbi:Uncharacterised protein [Collinsella intestinalis]|nr:Uncharacterised protein [Collinsella intestinalis]
MAASMVSGKISGRAASCTSAISQSAGTANKPLRVESCRSAPEGANAMGVENEYGSTALRFISSDLSGGHTTTMRDTRSAASNASSVQVMSGLPATSINSFPPGLPKRVPEPPATMIAQARVMPSAMLPSPSTRKRRTRAPLALFIDQNPCAPAPCEANEAHSPAPEGLKPRACCRASARANPRESQGC